MKFVSSLSTLIACVCAQTHASTLAPTSLPSLDISIQAKVVAPTEAKDYVVLISKKALADPEWKQVADTLVKKHQGQIIEWTDTVYDALPTLKKQAPRYLALVGPPEEINRSLINDLHRITRQFDDDPYGDCIWGIVTGYEPKDALRIASQNEPLTITRATGTTNIHAQRFQDSMVITDWQPFQYLEQHGHKEPKLEFYKEPLQENKDNAGKSLGVTPKLVEFWEKTKPQLMVSSSHATQFNLEMPFGKGIIISFGNKFYVLNQEQFKEFRTFLSGVLFNSKEEDLERFIQRIKAPSIKPSDIPAVWIAAGNCLIGDAKNSKNSMVVTALSNYGFNQLVGYTVPSWYGEGGWGTLRLFFDNHDKSSLAEAWYLNNQFILEWTQREYPELMKVHFNASDIQNAFNNPEFARGIAKANYGSNKDTIGLVHDRDTVAFYGDPKWTSKLDESHVKSPWAITWNDPSNVENGLTIKANNDAKTKFAVWFPQRIKAKKAFLTQGDQSIPLEEIGLLTNDFLLIRELNLKQGEEAVIIFK